MRVLHGPAAAVSETLAGAFGVAARLRGARAVHPRGPVLRATVRVDGLPGVPALVRPRDGVDALVRLSRSFGFPQGVPDILGIALRLHDVHGEGADQDVLVVSCLPGPVANPVPLVAGSYRWPTYSSLLPLRLGDQLAFLGARSLAGPSAEQGTDLEGARAAAAAGELGFLLTWAPVGGRWRTWGEVRVHDEVLEHDRAEALRFDPVLHAGDGIRLAGEPIADLRARAYRHSRAARPLARP